MRTSRESVSLFETHWEVTGWWLGAPAETLAMILRWCRVIEVGREIDFAARLEGMMLVLKIVRWRDRGAIRGIDYAEAVGVRLRSNDADGCNACAFGAAS